jgi:hypothetical protein
MLQDGMRLAAIARMLGVPRTRVDLALTLLFGTNPGRWRIERGFPVRRRGQMAL